jgi:2,3,4,5-tetrahydropyridine-2,6-dicarboxylate N-succinyltransferase
MPSCVKIGARSEIVEGVIVEPDSVVSMGVFIGLSAKIYKRETGEAIYGRAPAGSVVMSGNLPSADGKYSLYRAVIAKTRRCRDQREDQHQRTAPRRMMGSPAPKGGLGPSAPPGARAGR